MSLDGSFYKRGTTELRSEISLKRKNIESYVIARYGMSPFLAQQVSSILDKIKLNDRDICSGMYDSVIELAVQQVTKGRGSSLNDAGHIFEEERKETLYSNEQPNIQPQISQPQNVQLTEEQIEQFEKQKAKLQELQMQSYAFRSRIESRRGRR